MLGRGKGVDGETDLTIWYRRFGEELIGSPFTWRKVDWAACGVVSYFSVSIRLMALVLREFRGLEDVQTDMSDRRGLRVLVVFPIFWNREIGVALSNLRNVNTFASSTRCTDSEIPSIDMPGPCPLQGVL